VNVVICILVIGAVALVLWASRPSVMARYPTAPRPEEGQPASAREEEPRA
jgi:hypothetical protein